MSLSLEQVQAAIAEIDVRLGTGPRSAPLFVDRGSLLEMLGRKDEAIAAYIDALRIAPTHVDALNALGLLFLAAGNRETARTLLSGAVLHGPDHATAHANLAYLYVLDDQPDGARRLYEHALSIDPRLAIAHHGLANVLEGLGDVAAAARHRALGLQYRPITIERYLGDDEPVRVLALGTASLGNVPTGGFFDNHTFLLASLTVEHVDSNVPLPPHDLVFNAIGEADLCAEPLALAAEIIERSSAPVLNHPTAVAATSRVDNARRLATLAGISTPTIAAYRRHDLAAESGPALLRADGFAFPLLVRSPGYHTGDHFVKVDRPAELAEAIAGLPGSELFAIAYRDLRDAEGRFHKYRVMIVDGALYPLHLAISHTWKVHYFSAAMAETAAYRARDAAFLADLSSVLGASVIGALERVRATLGLDYGGIDFALDGAGAVIVFEANASMVVPSPGPESMWDYRRAPVARIRAAVRDMLVRRAAPPPSHGTLSEASPNLDRRTVLAAADLSLMPAAGPMRSL